MKRAVIILLLAFYATSSFSQTLNHVVKDDKGKKKLLGICNKKAFTQASFKEWYNKNHDAYLVNNNIVSKLKDSLNNYTIKAFFGSWCGDSKKELPRFYKILEAANFPENQLEVIAVDKTEDAYKQAPNHEEKGLNIHRVPTFIFYKNGKEVNRIVEHPKETLERDMLKIVTKNKYRSNYMIANYLYNLLEEKGVDSLQLNEAVLVPQLAEFIKGSRELNTFGYSLLRSNQTKKALYVFDLNTKIFPYKYNVYDSLGEAYFETKNYTDALKNYYKVLSLKPDDKNALEMVEKIKLKVESVKKEG